MKLEKIFKDFFDNFYSGRNYNRDFNLLFDFYFPKESSKTKNTLVELAEIYKSTDSTNKKLTKERVRQIKNDFENNVINNLDKNVFDKLLIVDYVLKIQKAVHENNNFISLSFLSKLFDESRSLKGFLEINFLLQTITDNYDKKLKIINFNNNGYVVPISVDKENLDEIFRISRRKVQHYGSVFPYNKLVDLFEAEDKFSIINKKIIEQILISDTSYFSLGNGDFLSFSDISKDKILSRIIKIFSVFDKVPTINVENSLYRTIIESLKNDKNKDLQTLSDCKELFIDYCIILDYCVEEDGYLIASEKVKKMIIDLPENNNQMFLVERKLVKILKENGSPMSTEEFIPFLHTHSSHPSHIMEFAHLIYRTGNKFNSKYHSIDDKYIVNDQEEEFFSVDRFRFDIIRIKRDSYLTKKIKKIFNNQCQICGLRIKINENNYYSEVHHIRPLGKPHNGPDEKENMICVCPNCHVVLDYGVISLNENDIKEFELNPISKKYIDYHNEIIFTESDEI